MKNKVVKTFLFFVLVAFLISGCRDFWHTEGVRKGGIGPGGGTIFSIEGNVGKEVSAILGSFNWDGAVKAAQDYRGGGFDNWYLPTSAELIVMMEDLYFGGSVNFGSEPYWSSTESGLNAMAVIAYSYTGYPSPRNKGDSYTVRAVRTFQID
jgi:hypothetical protein